jgi:hypothetical protein
MDAERLASFGTWRAFSLTTPSISWKRCCRLIHKPAHSGARSGHPEPSEPTLNITYVIMMWEELSDVPTLVRIQRGPYPAPLVDHHVSETLVAYAFGCAGIVGIH